MQRSKLQAVSLFAATPVAAGLLIIICLGLLIFRSNSLLDTTALTSPSDAAVNDARKPQAKAVNLSQLAALNLFGDAKTELQKEQAPAQQDIPETRLKLVLQGSFTSTKSEVSSALIATDHRGKAKRYFIGDELPGNALLHEVQPQYVVLKRGGRLEKLLFPREQAAIVGSDVAASPGVARQGKRPQAVKRNNEESLKKRLQQLREQLNQTNENIRI